MSTDGFTGLTLDAGALIAIENRSETVRRHLDNAARAGMDCAIPAGALAQVWRAGGRRVHLDRVLKLPHVQVRSLDAIAAKLAGELCGRTSTRNVIDASVVVCARRYHHAVITSDPDDIRSLDPALTILTV